MQTEIGKELRKLRIDKEQRLVDMAERLNVSASFISAIETGKKSPPINFEQTVAAAYDLSSDQLDSLTRAADASRTAFIVAPNTTLGRNTAGLLARQINTLSDKDLESIKRILLQHKKETK